jgi:ParB family chromosome partitioning protein
MARDVFKVDGDDQPKVKPARRTTGVTRKPIIKAGPASDKYIKAATQGGTDRTYQEISVDQIQDSAIKDRIDVKEDITSLIDSIEEMDQQIPIIVRVVQSSKPYEVVVGRRRLAAMRALNRPTIKAFVVKMDEREAFRLQGVENIERLETSFIERSRAAVQALDEGFSHQDVADFLSITKPMISMMTKVYRGVGEDLVVKIGAARGIGRRKWETLIELVSKSDFSDLKIIEMVDTSLESVERFEALIEDLRLGSNTPKPRRKTHVQSTKHVFLGGALSTTRKPHEITVKTDRSLPDELLDEIHASLETIVENWEKEKSGKT